MERLDRKNGSLYFRRLGSSCSHVCKVINFPNLKNIRNTNQNMNENERHMIFSCQCGGVGGAESWDKVVTNSKNKIQSVINWILQSSQIGILFVEVENIFLFCRTYVRWMHLHWIVYSVIGGDGRGEWNKSQKMNQDVVWLTWMHFPLLASVTSSAWEQWLSRSFKRRFAKISQSRRRPLPQ